MPKRVDKLPQKAEKYIPHSGPMCVVDDLLVSGSDTAEASVKVCQASLFLRSDGTLDEEVFVEMIAQTSAAGCGFELTDDELRNQEGYLIGLREVKVFARAKLGDELRVKVRTIARYADFGVIEGEVFRGDGMLAKGEIKVIQILKSRGGASA